MQYLTLTMSDYFLKNYSDKKILLLRHDVDRKPNNAFNIAKIENDYGISSTYYFRSTKQVFKPDLMKKIEAMGHEIGYHYEVLSKTNGDHEKAIILFKLELEEFRNYFSIKTICMHGSPLSKYDNRDLWKTYNYADFGILGEAYLSVDKSINYFSDTGRQWNGKNNIRDFIPNNKKSSLLDTTDDLIRIIKSRNLDNIYILVHPERWANNAEWALVYLQDALVNTGKKIITMVR